MTREGRWSPLPPRLRRGGARLHEGRVDHQRKIRVEVTCLHQALPKRCSTCGTRAGPGVVTRRGGEPGLALVWRVFNTPVCTARPCGAPGEGPRRRAKMVTKARNALGFTMRHIWRHAVNGVSIVVVMCPCRPCCLWQHAGACASASKARGRMGRAKNIRWTLHATRRKRIQQKTYNSTSWLAGTPLACGPVRRHAQAAPPASKECCCYYCLPSSSSLLSITMLISPTTLRKSCRDVGERGQSW